MKLTDEKEVNHIDKVIDKINEIFVQNKWEKTASSSSSTSSCTYMSTYRNDKHNYPFDKFTMDYNYNMNTVDVLIPVVNGDLIYKTTFTIGGINKDDENSIYSYIENHIQYYQERIICL